MKEWYAGLNQREQLSVLILGIAVVLYLLYALAWSPLSSERDELKVQNGNTAQSLQRVDAMVSEIMRLREEGGPSAARRNLTALVNQSTARHSLAVSRQQPNSQGGIQVRLENAAFDDLVAWLDQLENREGVLVTEVAITQTGNSGRVNATVRIAQS